MEIYIDSKFIECFALDTSHELHDELRSFLRKPQTGQKILNFESQEAFEKAALKNPLLEMLLESSVPTLNASFQQQMQEDTFYEEGGTKLFFNEDEANDQLQADFGCIFISSKQLNKAYFLFNWHLIPFTKHEPRFTNWDFMSQFRHPCNALIVTTRRVSHKSIPAHSTTALPTLPWKENIVRWIAKNATLQTVLPTRFPTTLVRPAIPTIIRASLSSTTLRPIAPLATLPTVFNSPILHWNSMPAPPFRSPERTLQRLVLPAI